MFRWQKLKVTITKHDGETIVHDYVGGCVPKGQAVEVSKEALHLWVQNGEYAPLKHVQSYPLTSIFSWHVENVT